jgi:Cof subfamily protein (haloacid dehalogenase superfamily)
LPKRRPAASSPWAISTIGVTPAKTARRPSSTRGTPACSRASSASCWTPTKLVIVSTAEQTDANVAHFRERFGSRLNVTKSYPLFTEIIHPDVSKGRALARLAEQLGIAREEVVAIGDNLNDLDMIEYAGLGIAMGNGAAAVKAAAGWVCPTQAEDGVAVAIEQRVLTGAPNAALARP